MAIAAQGEAPLAGGGRTSSSMPPPLPSPLPSLVTTVTIGMSLAAVVALALGTATVSDPAGVDSTTLRCTNPFSGATWDLAIDPERRTVDSFAADITGKSIAWRDSIHGGRYEFDRASGELTVIYASSMGGTFLTDQCRFTK